MSYIGAVKIGSGSETLIGSTLYGTCATSAGTAAKVVTLASFDTLMKGVTVFVCFTNGNTVLNNLTLKVGTTDAKPITGNCVCSANEIIAFTYDDNDGTYQYWRANHSLTIETTNNIVTTLSGQEVNLATKTYVDNATGGLSGLTGAMHFKGTSTTAITDGGTENPTIGGTALTTKESGDVVLYLDKEFVWNGTAWEILGDEGSYVLKTSQTTDSIGSASAWDAGSTPSLGTAIAADEIGSWSAGTASNAVVSQGILTLTNSTIPSLAHTKKSIPNVESVGSAPSLTITATTVVVPQGS